MDYGQNTPNSMTNGGEGHENNLDLSNQAIDWQLPMPNRDPNSIGNKTAIATAESLKPGAEVPRPTEVVESPELNEQSINTIANAIQNPTPVNLPQNSQPNRPQATTEDSPTDVIRQAEKALDQTGDIAGFYEAVCAERSKGNE